MSSDFLSLEAKAHGISATWLHPSMTSWQIVQVSACPKFLVWAAACAPCAHLGGWAQTQLQVKQFILQPSERHTPSFIQGEGVRLFFSVHCFFFSHLPRMPPADSRQRGHLPLPQRAYAFPRTSGRPCSSARGIKP